MSEKSKLIGLRLSQKITNEIDDEVKFANRKASARPYTRSSWIKHCVLVELERLRKKRRPKNTKTFVCSKCTKKIARDDIASIQGLLLGGEEYTCVQCQAKKVS